MTSNANLRRLAKWALILCCLGLCTGASAQTGPSRIKDLATLSGVRNNQLVGYGLVVGLDGTGDGSTPYTVQSLRSMLADLGVILPPNVALNPKNVAAVSLQAQLPPFAKAGQAIDVTVSSIGKAKSLRGGSLLMSPLKGADGRVYAMAQGNVVVGGLGVEAEGTSITINVPSAGRIPNGATVEREVPNPFSSGRPLVLNLHQPDFTTAQRVAATINEALGEELAYPLDPASVQVRGPQQPHQRVAFVSVLENLEVEPAAPPAKIIVNSRTGTVVIGQNVQLGPAAISHGNLTVTIAFDPVVSQPDPFSEGDTVVIPRADIQVEQENNPMFLFDPGVSLRDVVQAVNQVGASPSDLVAILEALKAAGALRAELIII